VASSDIPLNAALSATPVDAAGTRLPTILYHPKWEDLKTVDAQKRSYGTLRKENKVLRQEYSKLEGRVKEWVEERAKEGEERGKLEEEKNKAVEAAEKAEREKKAAEEEMVKMVEEKGRMEAERVARAAEAGRAKAEAEKAEVEKRRLRAELEAMKRVKEEVEKELARIRAEMPNEGELQQLRRLRGQTFTLREAIRELMGEGEGVSLEKLRDHERRLEVLEDAILRLTGKRPSEFQGDHSYGLLERLHIPAAVEPQQQQLPLPPPQVEPMAVDAPSEDSDEGDLATFVPGEVS
jgi:DNA repair exonuclease SbcCD ATPase subunit